MRSLAQPCVVHNTIFSLWEGQKWGFFPKDRTYRDFLHNKLFFLIAPRDLHYYWASVQPCAALRSLQHLFSLWEGQKWGFFPKDRTYRAFLHYKLFFLIAPRDLHYYWASAQPAQPCVVHNTIFSLWEGQKWGFFPKDRTYRDFLHNKLFFLIAPRDLHYYWASVQPCAALRSLQHLFSLWEGQKWGIFPKDRTYRAFLHYKLFFLIAPRDLHYYWASAQPCAALRSSQHHF